MYSDIHSVRSQPTRNNHSYQRPPITFDFDSPSQHSRINRQNWRTSIHPEVNAAYDLIRNGQPLHWGKTNIRGR